MRRKKKPRRTFRRVHLYIFFFVQFLRMKAFKALRDAPDDERVVVVPVAVVDIHPSGLDEVGACVLARVVDEARAAAHLGPDQPAGAGQEVEPHPVGPVVGRLPIVQLVVLVDAEAICKVIRIEDT